MKMACAKVAYESEPACKLRSRGLIEVATQVVTTAL
jgi:hypothetical protein